jgi:hypothetical protein
VVDRRRLDMWEQSMQMEALRLLSEWWDSRRTRPRWSPKLTARGATVADVLVLPPGYTPARLDERPAEVR